MSTHIFITSGGVGNGKWGAEWRIEANWPRRYGQLAINSRFDQPQSDGFNDCAGPV